MTEQATADMAFGVMKRTILALTTLLLAPLAALHAADAPLPAEFKAKLRATVAHRRHDAVHKNISAIGLIMQEWRRAFGDFESRPALDWRRRRSQRVLLTSDSVWNYRVQDIHTGGSGVNWFLSLPTGEVKEPQISLRSHVIRHFDSPNGRRQHGHCPSCPFTRE